jgi:hypothetical protein
MLNTWLQLVTMPSHIFRVRILVILAVSVAGTVVGRCKWTPIKPMLKPPGTKHLRL